MEFSVTTLPKSQVEVRVTVSPEEMERERERALEALRPSVAAEGFRLGHVPTEIAAQKIGEERLMVEAANGAARTAFDQVVQEQDLDPVGEPEIEVKKLAPGNPFEFTLRVSVLPAVCLPDYRAIASGFQANEVAVEDSEVDEALAWLQKSRTQEGGPIPEPNGEFAKSPGTYEGLEALKESIREGLLEEKKGRERSRLRQEILGKIAEETQGEIPDLLVAREKARMLENVKRGAKGQMNMEFDDYLKKIEKSEDDLLESFTNDAERRIKEQLVLREIVRAEELMADEKEVEEEISRFLSLYSNPEEAKKAIDPERLRAYSEDAIVTEKAFKILESEQDPHSYEPHPDGY